MRIALTGAHGTGKTTLARVLAEKLNLPLITEAVRQASRLYNIRHTDEIRNGEWPLKAGFQDAVWDIQLVTEESLECFISDRSILDVVAYSLYYGLDGYRWQRRRDWAVKYARSNYNLLVYIPIEFSLKADGFRDTDPDFQKEVDRRISELLQLVPWPVITVSGSVEERAQQVLDYLAGRKGVVTNAPRTS